MSPEIGPVLGSVANKSQKSTIPSVSEAESFMIIYREYRKSERLTLHRIADSPFKVCRVATILVMCAKDQGKFGCAMVNKRGGLLFIVSLFAYHYGWRLSMA